MVKRKLPEMEQVYIVLLYWKFGRVWSIAPVLKTGGQLTLARGFESLSFRIIEKYYINKKTQQVELIEL